MLRCHYPNNFGILRRTKRSLELAVTKYYAHVFPHNQRLDHGYHQ